MGRVVAVVVGVVLVSACSSPAEPSGPTPPASPTGAAASPSSTVSPSPTPDGTSTSPTPSTEADRQLLAAARDGDATAVRAALDAGADVEARNSDGATALVLAAYRNHLAAARVLVEAGADVNHEDETQQSAFLISTSEVGDDPRLLDLMLANAADLAAKDSFNGTGLIRAADRGFPVIIDRLLDAGIEIDHVNRLGWTALHEAVILGDGSQPYVQVVRRLLAAGADPLLPSQQDGVRPVAHAERLGHDRIAELLRDAARGLTPEERLLRHSQNGSEVAAQAALDDGAGIEARDDRGRTALLLAATYNRVRVARVLVARGADVNAYDDRRDTPFLVTGVTGSVPMLEALLPGRPDTRLRNRFGGVAVIPASERGHAAYVRAVLARTDIDVDHVNDLGWTALLEAVILGDGGPRHQATVAALLDGGADTAIADRDGVTPLQHAQRRGQDAIVALLSR